MNEKVGQDFVVCRECNKKFKRISPQHLWFSHRMSFEEYQIKYPDEKTMIDVLRVSKLKGKTYEQIYGRDNASTLVSVKRKKAEENWRKKKQSIPLDKESFVFNSKLSGRFSVTDILVQRAGGVCERCGGVNKSGRALSVHHKDGRRWVNVLDNLLLVCSKCHNIIHTETRRAIGRHTMVTRIEKSCYAFLEALSKDLNIDMSADDYCETPARMARMYYELFGANIDREERVKEILTKTFSSKHDGMVTSSNIKVYSMCKHHFLPVIMDVTLAYIPKDRVLGLSKLARIAELFGAKPLIQEDYTQELADTIMRVLKPEGVGVYVKGVHYCQTMRGVKQQNAVMTTTDVRGCFRKDEKCRAEFLAEAKRGGLQ